MYHILFIILIVFSEISLMKSSYHLEVNLKEDCPDLYLEAFLGFAPKGNLSAGTYIKKDSVYRITDCLAECCNDPLCNVVFMHDTSCLHVRRGTMIFLITFILASSNILERKYNRPKLRGIENYQRIVHQILFNL